MTMEPRNTNPDAPSLRHRLRALVVDDSKFQQFLLEGFLAILGVESLVANNGEEALNFMREGAIVNLIIIDKEMPTMDGIQAFYFLSCKHESLAKLSNQELIDMIQAIRRLRGMGVTTKIVGISAYSEREVEQEFLDAGADEYIAKPVRIEKLISLLEEIDNEI